MVLINYLYQDSRCLSVESVAVVVDLLARLFVYRLRLAAHIIF